MSWLSSLYQTYQYALKHPEYSTEQNNVELLPMYHSYQNAQINLILDEDANLVRAETIAKEDAITLIPITENSGARTSGSCPHPLHDNITYIAGDLNQYIFVEADTTNKEYIPSQTSISSKKDPKIEYFEKYINQLKEWIESDYADPFVKIVYDYLRKETVVADLIRIGVFELSDEKYLNATSKIQNITQDKAFVRFSIEQAGKRIDLWKNKNIADSFIRYYDTLEADGGLCYVTGENRRVTQTHPKYLRFSGDGSKLISSNDNTNFTFRGRISEATEGAQVGLEISQKAHSALRWLIQRQGRNYDGFVLLVWAPMGEDFPALEDDTEVAMKIPRKQSRLEKIAVDFGDSYAKEVSKAIAGYQHHLTEKTTIHIIGLDAATPGRLSILYYRELGGGEYLARVKKWHIDMAWLHFYKKNEEGKLYAFIGTPTLKDIATAVNGHEQGNVLIADKKILKKEIERLVSCVLDGARLPEDMVKMIIVRASSPNTMSWYNWNKTLGIACSLVKKYYKERFKEDWTMALDRENRNRSYLFGRLLAVADRIEEMAYYADGKKESRMTNAMRYMDAFSKRPFRIWMNIENAVEPYLAKLSAGQRAYYRKELDEIMCLFESEDYTSKKKLDGRYLLGFHCESQYFKNRQSQSEPNIEDEDQNNELEID